MQVTVRIRATITKDILVDAPSEQAAIEQAHELFSVLPDGEERYEEETLHSEILPGPAA